MDAYDFRRGQYRRIYSSAKYGQRINRVSDFAARLLGWGLIPITDDFGNFSGNPVIVKSECFPLLERTVQQIDSAIRELQAEKLIGLYALGSEQFLHIHGHLHLQPAAANGRRVRRWPPSPWDAEPDLSPDSPSDCGILGNPGEPGKSGGQQTTTITTTKTTSSSAAQKSKGNTLPSPYPLGKSAAAAAEFLESFPADPDPLPTMHLADQAGLNPAAHLDLLRCYPQADWPGILTAVAERRHSDRVRNPAGLCRTLAEKGFTPAQEKAQKGRTMVTPDGRRIIAAVQAAKQDMRLRWGLPATADLSGEAWACRFPNISREQKAEWDRRTTAAAREARAGRGTKPPGGM